MDETPSIPTKEKKVIPVLIGSALILLLLIALTTFFLQSASRTGATVSGPFPTLPVSAGNTRAAAGDQRITYTSLLAQAPTLPTVRAASWSATFDESSVSATSSAQAYLLRPSASQALFESLTTLLFPTVSPIINQTDARYLTQVGNANDSALLYMKKISGSFLYYAPNGGVELSAESEFGAQLQDLVAQLFGGDKTIQLSAQYAQPSTPAVEYFEFHRNKASIGLPVAQPFGLLGGGSLSQATLQDAGDGLEVDTASIEKNVAGYNTITVGVKDSRIVSIRSTMRFLNTQAPSSALNLTNVDGALDRLRAGKGMIYVAPTVGASARRVFARPNLELAQAQIDEVELMYVEDVPFLSQLTLSPHYVFSGQGVSAGGELVRFVATVPAASAITTKNAQSSQRASLQKQVQAGSVRGSSKTQQQSTFTMESQQTIARAASRSAQSKSDVAGVFDSESGAALRAALAKCSQTNSMAPVHFGVNETGALLGLFIDQDQLETQWFGLPKEISIRELYNVLEQAQGGSVQVRADESARLINTAEATSLPCPIILSGGT